MLVPPPPVAPAPLFRARIVTLGLRRDTVLHDVRRGRRAVGRTTDHGGDWRSDASVVVLGGRGVLGQGTGAPQTASEPVALRGARGFVVEFRRWGADGIPKVAGYRAGSLRGARIALGGPVVRPSDPAPGVPFGAEEAVPFPRAFWPRTEEPEWSRFPETAMVGWAPVRGLGVSVGYANLVPRNAAGEPGTPYDPYRTALVKSGGRVELLVARTLGAPKAGFGKVLWVSREGWLVATAGQGDGLAWLEPVRR